MKLLNILMSLIVSLVTFAVQAKNKFMASMLVLFSAFTSSSVYAAFDPNCFDGDDTTACSAPVMDTSGPLAVINDNLGAITVIGLAMLAVAILVRMSTKPKRAG